MQQQQQERIGDRKRDRNIKRKRERKTDKKRMQEIQIARRRRKELINNLNVVRQRITSVTSFTSSPTSTSSSPSLPSTRALCNRSGDVSLLIVSTFGGRHTGSRSTLPKEVVSFLVPHLTNCLRGLVCRPSNSPALIASGNGIV